MRILWVHNVPPGLESAGQFIFTLADAMREVGTAVDLFSTGSLRSVMRLAAARRKVSKLSEDYDLVHAQFGTACAYAAARSRCPRIVSLRGTEMLGCDTGPLWCRMHGVASRWLTHSSIHRFHRVIVMSHRMRDDLSRVHNRASGVEILPDGIDLAKFAPMDRSHARRELGFAGDTRPWVLFASLRTNNPVKRSELALAAFRRASVRRPDLVLKTLSGRPHQEVPLWMSASNVLLLTSTREGWPNVVKESLACNVPFVATDVSDLKRISDQEPSCFVGPANPDALAEGILNAIGAPSSESLRRQVQFMERTAIARRLCEIYEMSLVAPRCAAA
jgi:teichuronic acid biosynthesis glycosyltransferase TuaC